MKQIVLDMPLVLNYSADNFFAHRGVSDMVTFLTEHKSNLPLPATFIYGGKRMGKTHFIIYLQKMFVESGKRIRTFEFEDLRGMSPAIDWDQLLVGINICLIDDFDLLVEELLSWNAIGSIVTLFEVAKLNNVSLVISTSTSIENFSTVDVHVLSRLKASTWFEMNHPAENEVAILIDVMAKQRGYKFSQRQIAFLTKRLRKDPASLESYLTRLKSWSDFAGEPINFASLNEVL